MNDKSNAPAMSLGQRRRSKAHKAKMRDRETLNKMSGLLNNSLNILGSVKQGCTVSPAVIQVYLNEARAVVDEFNAWRVKQNDPSRS